MGGSMGVCGEREGERRAGLEPESLVGQLDAGEGRRMRSGAGRLMNLPSIAAPLGGKSQRKEGEEKAGQPLFALTTRERRRSGPKRIKLPK